MTWRRLLALAALAVLVPAAQAAPSARTIVISNYADDGSPGTLRHALENAAVPGDTITFASSVRLELRTPLVVPARLAGLTIDGATAAGGRVTLFGARFTSASATLAIDADSVTLRNLTFLNLPVEYRARTTRGPAGGRVLDNEFRYDATYPRRPRLQLSFTRGARVEANTFAGAELGGLELEATQASVVTGNTFAAGGLVDHDSRGLRIEGNTATRGRFFLETVAATIEGNTFGARSGLVVGDVADEGHVRVVGNTIEVAHLRTGLTVAATERVEVRGNTVRGTGGRTSGISAGCREQHPGLAVVENNRILDLRVGLTIACAKKGGRFVVRGNTVRGNAESGIVVRAHHVELGRNTVEGNGSGIVVERAATIRGATVRANRRAGVLVRRGAEAEIRGLLAGGNGGPGIDASAGVPYPEASHDAKSGKLRGTACAGCTVEVYESEDGAKKGNPRNGEGRRPLGTVRAGGDGRWTFPARRPLDCPRSGKVTMTATKGEETSEFSVDVECGCLLGRTFAVSGAGTPRTGSRAFGLRVFFPKGSRLERATVADVRTDERPTADALGEMLVWREGQKDVPAPAGLVGREYFVEVSYRPGETGFALSRAVWRYSIAYEPPRGTTGCSARATEFRR